MMSKPLEQFTDSHGRVWVSLERYAEIHNLRYNTLVQHIRHDDKIAPEIKTKVDRRWYLLADGGYFPRRRGRPVTSGDGLRRPDRVRNYFPNRPDLRSATPREREHWRNISAPPQTEPADV